MDASAAPALSAARVRRAGVVQHPTTLVLASSCSTAVAIQNASTGASQKPSTTDNTARTSDSCSSCRPSHAHAPVACPALMRRAATPCSCRQIMCARTSASVALRLSLTRPPRGRHDVPGQAGPQERRGAAQVVILLQLLVLHESARLHVPSVHAWDAELPRGLHRAAPSRIGQMRARSALCSPCSSTTRAIACTSADVL